MPNAKRSHAYVLLQIPTQDCSKIKPLTFFQLNTQMLSHSTWSKLPTFKNNKHLYLLYKSLSVISSADLIFQILWMRCNIFHNLFLYRTLKMYYHPAIFLTAFFFNCWYFFSFFLNNMLFIHILNLTLKILYQMKISMTHCFQKVLSAFPEYPKWIWSELLSSRRLDERKIFLNYRKGNLFSHP